MKVYQVRQRLASHPISDVSIAVRHALDGAGLEFPMGRVAVTVGSRGIANLDIILRTASEWLRERGAQPFAVPAMGSHNGATAEGQQAMLESLGLDEVAIGMPIRSSMETKVVGQVDTGDVHVDRYAHEADCILLVNRVKLHTSFAGPLGSGLAKMAAVGLGKLGGAETFHLASTNDKPDVLRAMAEQVIATGKIWAGLAILEDGFDQTSELHALPGDAILDREPALLERHRELFPQLPVDELNVLIVQTIGKNLSGTGMDTNVIGRRGLSDADDLPQPRIGAIGALELSPQSQGNAVGVGLTDCVTRRLYDAIDRDKTDLNARTTGQMKRVQIPAVVDTDQSLFDQLRTKHGKEGWMIIPNTLHLGTLLASPDVAERLRSDPACDVVDDPLWLEFDEGRLVVEW